MIPRFLQPAVARVTLSGNSIRFDDGLTFQDEDGIYHVPPEVWSNGSSVPRLGWWLCGHPLDRKNRRPGHVHDRLVTRRKAGQLPVSRERAARVFRKALKAEGKSWLGRWVMWAAVYGDAIWRRWFTGLTGKPI